MLKKITIICFGSTLIGIGINGFILPFHLINGGIFGISLLLNYILGFKTGLIFVLLNLPIYAVAYNFDKLYFINGLIGATISGITIELFMPFGKIFHLPILSSIIIGASIIGIGVGVLLRNHISPGGIDLLALLISKWTRINVGIVIYIIDTLIIMSGLLLLGDAKLLYSLLIVSIVGIFAYSITTFRNVFIYM